MHLFDVLRRAMNYDALTPGERAALKVVKSLGINAGVTGGLTILYAAMSLVTGGAFEPKNVAIAGGMAALTAFVNGAAKYMTASNDPALEEIAAKAQQATQALQARAARMGAYYPAATSAATATASRYAPMPTMADPYDTRETEAAFLNDQPPLPPAPTASLVTRQIPPIPGK